MKELDADSLRETLRVMIRRLGFLHKSGAGCYGLTMGQCHAIIEIGAAKRIPIARLAESLNLDASTATRNVDNLERAGLVVREPSTDDRRVSLLSLTEEGVDRLNKINVGMNRYYGEVLASIPQAKLPIVAEGLELFVSALNPMPLDEEASSCCEAKGKSKQNIKSRRSNNVSGWNA